MSGDAIPAATLILVRDRPSARPELLVVERSAEMAFAPGATVFPGGRIDPDDEHLAAAIGRPGEGAALAAIRETLEETAVPVGLQPVPSFAHALELQRQLLARASFGELIGAAGLRLDVKALTPFARWRPGHIVSRRFDTTFFVAEAPPGEWPAHVGSSECASARWMSAEDLLWGERDRQLRLIYPTRKNLERLAQHRSFADVLQDAGSHPVVPITPAVEERDGRQLVTIPEGLGYPITSDLLNPADRG